MPAMADKIYISIPAVPPSVNNYVRHTRTGIHYKTPEANNFSARVALAAGEHRNAQLEAESVTMTITLPPKAKGDIDNFPKVVLDSLVRYGVIRSDATIMRLLVAKCRGDEPQTEVWIS